MQLEAALRKAEWSARRGCEGFQMGAPPMHYHPVCPLCEGHEPTFNAKFPGCFRTRERALALGLGKSSGVIVGHEPDCIMATLGAPQASA